MEQIRDFVIQYYSDNYDERFAYHDLGHVLQVHDAVLKLVQGAGLDSAAVRQLQIAALFHDVGYSLNPEKHELIGADICADYLYSIFETEETIDRVCSLILATFYPRQPLTLAEEIIRDADLSYLGSDDFWVGSAKLRNEWSATKGLEFSDREWLRLNATFLLGHKFYSKNALTYLGPLKQKNLQAVLKALAEKSTE